MHEARATQCEQVIAETCSVSAAWGLGGLRMIVRFFLELSGLQKKENIQRSTFLPKAQRNLDIALVLLFQETKQEICLDPLHGEL